MCCTPCYGSCHPLADCRFSYHHDCDPGVTCWFWIHPSGHICHYENHRHDRTGLKTRCQHHARNDLCHEGHRGYTLLDDAQWHHTSRSPHGIDQSGHCAHLSAGPCQPVARRSECVHCQSVELHDDHACTNVTNVINSLT